ncbi:MAG: rhomboid family intramembrane serine protease [Verrucomicrobiota bacterium]
MFSTPYSTEKPFFYLGRYPVNLTLLLVLIHSAGLIISVIVGPGIERILDFSTNEVRNGKFWQLITYPFFVPPIMLVGEAISLVFFFLFGRMVEERFRRDGLLNLYVVLVIVPSLVLLVLSFLLGRPFQLVGISTISLSIFLAFVFIYPDARMLFGLIAKWVALFFVVVYSLMFLGNRNFVEFSMLWLRIGLTYGVLRYLGLPALFPSAEQKLFGWLPDKETRARRKSRKNLKVVKRGDEGGKKKKKPFKSKLAPRVSVPEDKKEVASIDDVLEKISKTGLASLSDDERKRLESASESLTNKDKPS